MPICPHCATDYKEGTEHVCPDKPSHKSDEKELKALVGDMPQVVPDAVEASQKKEDEIKKSQGEAIDRKGTKFDPKIHKTDKDGNPIITPKTGKFSRKLNIPEGATQATPLQPQIDLVSQEAKEWTVLIVTVTAAFVAEEAEPTPSEFERIKIGLEGVFRKYGTPAMGCEMVLLSSIAGYMVPRLMNPKKPTGLYLGIKGWIIGLLPKKPVKKEEQAK